MNVSIKNNSGQEKRQGFVSYHNKWIVTSVWLVAIMSTYFIIQAAVTLSERYQKISYPESLIYGVWIESEVAPYRAERLEINAVGIVFDGAVVATEFEFDGEFLVYQHGTQKRRFKFQNHNWNEMKQLTDSTYQPIFVKTASK
ncbi:DUF2850 domain-containing protein [Vibrio fluminensis]|uniref:DUF2850 domain-containing protein n=1 Tax=Vibrio fluminensis TaxID=2783614 RepID=UPI0018890254|nr:DUF2850 domain-containing protein [Vibrio fluminensis]